MTGAKKLRYVEDQIKTLRAGKSDSLRCPYCGIDNLAVDEGPMCCEVFSQAVAAILHRQGMQKVQDQAARVADAVSRN